MAYVDADFDGRPVRICRTGYTGEHGYELIPAWADAPRAVGRAARGRAGRRWTGRPGSAAATRCAPRWATRCTGRTCPASITPGAGPLGLGGRLGRSPSSGAATRCWPSGPPGRARLLWGIESLDRGIPRPHMARARRRPAQPVGEVTSGTFSPTLQARHRAGPDRLGRRRRASATSWCWTCAGGRPPCGWSSRRSSSHTSAEPVQRPARRPARRGSQRRAERDQPAACRRRRPSRGRRPARASSRCSAIAWAGSPVQLGRPPPARATAGAPRRRPARRPRRPPRRAAPACGGRPPAAAGRPAARCRRPPTAASSAIGSSRCGQAAPAGVADRGRPCASRPRSSIRLPPRPIDLHRLGRRSAPRSTAAAVVVLPAPILPTMSRSAPASISSSASAAPRVDRVATAADARRRPASTRMPAPVSAASSHSGAAPAVDRGDRPGGVAGREARHAGRGDRVVGRDDDQPGPR